MANVRRHVIWRPSLWTLLTTERSRRAKRAKRAWSNTSSKRGSFAGDEGGKGTEGGKRAEGAKGVEGAKVGGAKSGQRGVRP